MIVVNYGGGKNSTAMLIEAVRRGERPDLILFANTGGEKPKTYAYLVLFDDWLQAHDFPPIITVKCVRQDGIDTLEAECLQNQTLPSKAFGNAGCSVKWKVQPQDKYLEALPAVATAWAAGERVERWLGFHIGERHRADRRAEKDAADPKWSYRYPLIEWDMDEVECREVIVSAGLPLPPKSACFFCPSSKPWELRVLKEESPELLARAIAMERHAKPNLTSIVGLGGYWAWENEMNQTLLPGLTPRMTTGIDIDCACYDGD